MILTVPQGTRTVMKTRLFATLAAALLAFACGDVHTPGQDITAPSTPTATGAPTQIRVLGSSRSDQQLDITAQVLTADGKPVGNIPVQFSLTNGILNPVVATTDASGNAKTIAATFAASVITAKIGTGLTGSGTFAIASGSPLTVSINAPSVVVGSSTTLTASTNTAAIGGAFTYVWTFGDAKSETGTAASIAHAYPGIGSYTASVKVTDGAGRSATAGTTATVTDVPVVTPAPSTTTDTSGLVASLTCTAAAHSTPSPCNVSVTYNGKALASTSITGIAWDWGDGSTVAGAAVPLGSHTYAQAGSYVVTATATATTTDGSKTAPLVSKSLVIS